MEQKNLKTHVFTGGCQLSETSLSIFAGKAPTCSNRESWVDLIIEILDDKQILYVFGYRTLFQNFFISNEVKPKIIINKELRHVVLTYTHDFDLLPQLQSFCNKNGYLLCINTFSDPSN